MKMTRQVYEHYYLERPFVDENPTTSIELIGNLVKRGHIHLDYHTPGSSRKSGNEEIFTHYWSGEIDSIQGRIRIKRKTIHPLQPRKNVHGESFEVELSYSEDVSQEELDKIRTLIQSAGLERVVKPTLQQSEDIKRSLELVKARFGL
jgi:hypothetical protein